MDDDSRRRALLRRSFAWDTDVDLSGWPEPPSFWTEEHTNKIRRNHGLEAGMRLIPIFRRGVELGEAHQGLNLLIVGSPCRPDSLKELEDIGVPRLTLTRRPHGRRVLAIWLIRVEQAGSDLRLERRVSLHDDFNPGETVVTDLGQNHTVKEYAEIRRRGLYLLDLLDAVPVVGRPEHTGYYGLEEGPRFAADIDTAVRVLIRDGKRINKTTVSKQLPMDRETLSGYLTRFRVNLKSVETKILADESYSRKSPQNRLREVRRDQ